MGRGINNHPMYSAWSGMVNRCTNQNNSSYHLYGARGIYVCDRWRFGDGYKSGFKCWLEDMGPRPEGMTLDRVDGNGPYGPSNCRWATHKEQRNNQTAAGKERQREGARAGAAKRWQDAKCEPDRTHCRHGHEFTPENKYTRPDGKFECRRCTLDRSAELRRKAGVPKRNLKGHHSPRFQKAASTAIAARRA